MWCIDSDPKTNNNTHLHIDLRTPPIKGWPDNLLADNAVLDQPSSAVSETLRTAAQGLLGAVAPQLTLNSGNLTMFVMDVPPDIPPQYAPIVVAEAAQAKQQSNERTLGVCQLIESRPESRLSAVNAVLPAKAVWGYLKYIEHQAIDDAAILSAKMTLLQPPTHGTLKLYEKTQSGRYFLSEPNYEGADQATVLVEIGGYQVKVIYFFNVMPDVPGSGAQGSPYDDPDYCPNGRRWRISFDANDPFYTFEHPFALSRALAGPRTHKPISDLTRES